MLPIEISLLPIDRLAPLVALLTLSALAGLLAWVVLRSLRRRR